MCGAMKIQTVLNCTILDFGIAELPNPYLQPSTLALHPLVCCIGIEESRGAPRNKSVGREVIGLFAKS